MFTSSRRIQYAQVCPKPSVLNYIGGELEANHWDDRMTPEILGVRVDIHLAVKADLYFATEKWDLVVDISKYLAEKYVDQPQWWVHWANALKEMGKVKEAKEVALRGLKIHPDVTVLHFNLACYDSLLGKFRSAKKRLNRALKLNNQLRAFSNNDPDLAGLRNWWRSAEV